MKPFAFALPRRLPVRVNYALCLSHQKNSANARMMSNLPAHRGYPSWIPISEMSDIHLQELMTNDAHVENAQKMLEEATGFYFAAYRA